MTRPSGLVFDTLPPVTVGGLTLAGRAVGMLRRGGISPVRVWSPSSGGANRVLEATPSGEESVARVPPPPAPLEQLRADEAVVVVGPGVLFGPEVLAELSARAAADGGRASVVVDEAGAPLVLLVPAGAGTGVAACRSVDEMAAALSGRPGVLRLDGAGLFCRRVGRADLRNVERDYVRHLNGSESFFTKRIRWFSVPLSIALVRLGATPTQVTLAGLALAIVSAWCIAQGSYALGVLGAAVYYASMVLDCSDGEVARLTMRDSAFGAWLETAVDYTTYFLLLAALLAASQTRASADAYRVAGAIALLGSIVVTAVAGYLRHRVAAADPGQFDDASARAMAEAGRFHRFARWSRQWIKRSAIAHLVVALALVNQLPGLLYLWAFGATAGALVIVAVEPFVARRVNVVRSEDRFTPGRDLKGVSR